MSKEFLNAMVERAKERELVNNNIDDSRYGELGNKLIHISSTWESEQEQRRNNVKSLCREPALKSERQMEIQKRQM